MPETKLLVGVENGQAEQLVEVILPYRSINNLDLFIRHPSDLVNENRENRGEYCPSLHQSGCTELLPSVAQVRRVRRSSIPAIPFP
jgi:hypothetical protein